MSNDLKEFESRMKGAIENLDDEYNAIRAGRANPNILDKIKVDYYGQPTPIQQVGNVSVPEPRVIMIQPWDSSILKDIEKAINISDIGLSPSNDGKAIRLVFPELTEERRKDIAKDVKKIGENSKVAIRNIRRDANDYFKKLNKDNEITEDDLRAMEDAVQKLTDKYIEVIDNRIEAKSKEILTV
ncbi:ribosome recycling factor [Natranaerovirga hydrolytica]|uniref:Ribosome-recycling factor n=1 Tax=Natranaerovirga hydrolytica TaxID=680378 RepID=A0A4R1MXE0_9FIRM|nr:ribosome recycling factor [Natranaerovirga hydrolytica]TCK97927.1 ribosome recycling factor [Natranaerovirga hydrolytica]